MCKSSNVDLALESNEKTIVTVNIESLSAFCERDIVLALQEFTGLASS